MRLNTSIVIAATTLALGLIFSKSYIVLPVTVLFAGTMDLFTRRWVMSERLGSYVNLSMFFKFTFSLVGLYAMLGQFACIGLTIWWFVS